MMDTSRPTVGLVGRVKAEITRRIAARTLVAGMKLPSIRAFAEIMQVSKSTVVEAYDRLAAEGVIVSRAGSGFYVAAISAPLKLSAMAPRVDRAIDPLWVSRQSLDSRADMLKPGCGWLPDNWMVDETLRKSLRQLARAPHAELSDYGAAAGYQPLRSLLARRVEQQGIDISPEQILLTESGTQAVDLLCRFLLQPGDTVLVDDPCYFNFLALLRAHRVDVCSVPYDQGGPDIAAFEKILQHSKPKIYMTNSAIHNPTGATLSAMTAHRLLRLAEDHQLTIIEDDIFADFELEPAARLASFDGLERVVQVGSFSKTLSASVRCGYIAMPRDWIESLTDLRIATGFGGAQMSAKLVYAVLTDGSYRKHLEQLRQRLSKTMAQLCDRLAGLDIQPIVQPEAGIFLWTRLPRNTNAADIAMQALDHDILLAPGNIFSVSQTAADAMRFNIAQTTDSRIFKFLEKALDG